jgi:hypothetical protein
VPRVAGAPNAEAAVMKSLCGENAAVDGSTWLSVRSKTQSRVSSPLWTRSMRR